MFPTQTPRADRSQRKPLSPACMYRCIYHASMCRKLHRLGAGPRNCHMKPHVAIFNVNGPLGSLPRKGRSQEDVKKRSRKKNLEVVVGEIQLTSDSVVPRKSNGSKETEIVNVISSFMYNLFNMNVIYA